MSHIDEACTTQQLLSVLTSRCLESAECSAACTSACAEQTFVTTIVILDAFDSFVGMRQLQLQVASTHNLILISRFSQLKLLHRWVHLLCRSIAVSVIRRSQLVCATDLITEQRLHPIECTHGLHTFAVPKQIFICMCVQPSMQSKRHTVSPALVCTLVVVSHCKGKPSWCV